MRSGFYLALAVILAVTVLMGGACASSESGEPSFTFMGLPEALANGLPTVGEFGADSCIPCKRMRPILAELATEYEGRLNIAFVDLYRERNLGSQYQIRTMPTQVIFDAQGKEIDRHVGFWSKADMIDRLQELGLI